MPEGAKDIQAFDDELPGFGCRKYASGKAVFFVKYNVGSQQRRKKLSAVVKGNLKDMRVEASKVLAKAQLGIDVVAEANAAAAKSSIPTLGELVPKYLEAREGELRAKTLVELTRYLAGTKDKKGNERTPPVFKAIYKLPIDAITSKDVMAIVKTIEHKVAADRARTALSGLFAWAIDEEYRDDNPTLTVAARGQNGGRKRVLTEAELVEVWKACGDDDYGRIVRLLILTGQRRAEIGKLSEAARSAASPGPTTRPSTRPASVSVRLTFIRPLSPSAAVLPPKGDDWLHEPKWDGFRFQIIKDGSQVRFYSRHGADTVIDCRAWSRPSASCLRNRPCRW